MHDYTGCIGSERSETRVSTARAGSIVRRGANLGTILFAAVLGIHSLAAAAQTPEFSDPAVVFKPDPYGRDPKLLKALDRPKLRANAPKRA